MPNKRDQFDTKFWLAADLASKYLGNDTSHLGKYEHRPLGLPLDGYAVLKLAEAYLITSSQIFPYQKSRLPNK